MPNQAVAFPLAGMRRPADHRLPACGVYVVQVLGERAEIDYGADLRFDDEVLVALASAVAELDQHVQAPSRDPLLKPDLNGSARDRLRCDLAESARIGMRRMTEDGPNDVYFAHP